MKTIMIGGILFSAPALAFGAVPNPYDDGFEQHMNLKPQQYETRLDIKRLVHISDHPHDCEISLRTIIYEDSTGKHQRIEYLVAGTKCD